LANAHAVGASTSLDLCMPDPSRASGKADWRAILARALPEVDVFAPSAEELLFMLSRSRFDHLCTPQADGLVLDRLRVDDVVALADTALELGAQIVVIKAGHRGLYLRTGSLTDLCGRGRPADLSAWKNREIWAPAFRVQVVGTTGAGDATVGGFLMAILRGLAPSRAANAAAAVGASNCEAADAVSGVRSWADTLLRMAGDWERLDAAIDANGWRWCESEGGWIGPRDAAA